MFITIFISYPDPAKWYGTIHTFTKTFHALNIKQEYDIIIIIPFCFDRRVAWCSQIF